MNSYSLGIDGSWFIYVLLVLIAAGIAVYSYRITVPPISSGKRTFLITLRTAAMALLLFVLLEPVINIVSGKTESPKLVVMIDNSISAGTNDGKYNRDKLVIKAIDNAALGDFGEDELIIATFGDKIKKQEAFTTDSLVFDNTLSNISGALSYSSSLMDSENIGATLLISDGAYNDGENPVYMAETFGKPIFVIGIGDSTQPKDLVLKNIITNKIAFVNSTIPVNLNFSVNGYDEGEVKIKLLEDENEISEQTVKIYPEKKDYSVVFEYKPELPGDKKITFTADPLPGELTIKNNVSSEFVKVLENKRKISLFAGAPSPDVSFIIQNFSDEQYEIHEFIQKQSGEFYTQSGRKELRESELIILVGFPNRFTPNETIALINNELSKDKPLLFIPSFDLDYNKLKALEQFLPFNVLSTGKQEFKITPMVAENAINNSLLKLNGEGIAESYWNELPPVFRTETFVKVKPESKILLGSKMNNVELADPLLMQRSFQNNKSVTFLAYGLYRWKLFGYAKELSKGRTETPDLYSTLLNNSIRWLSIDEERKNVVIKPVKQEFNQSESVEFIAQIYDNAYNPIDNSFVKVVIKKGEINKELNLSPIGNGKYLGTVTGLEKGDFSYSGYATLSDERLGIDEGRFTIGDTPLEYQNLQMNANLLRNISTVSGGKFYLPENAQSFRKDLENSGRYKPKAITIRSDIDLWNNPWLLAIAVVLFAIEWFIRKRSGMV